MADRSKIEWTDATWTPVKGCTRASEGCRNCYAEIMAARFSKPGQWGEGLAAIVETPAGKDHRWTGGVRFDDAELLKPLRWRTPRKVFVCSTSDLFHESVPDEWIDRVFDVMRRSPDHVFQVLTKRAARMREYVTRYSRLPDNIGAFYDLPTDGSVKLYQPLRNVWLGVSVEDQQRANERVPDLLATPAAIRWLSCEPLLGAVDLRRLVVEHPSYAGVAAHHDGLAGQLFDLGDSPIGEPAEGTSKLDWVVVGGESGPGARPMHPDWARGLRDQCGGAGVPMFFKQWGEFLPVFDRDVEDPDWRNCGKWKHTHPKGRWHNLAGGTGFHGERVIYVAPVGKKTAGRLLDGVQHDGMPA